MVAFINPFSTYVETRSLAFTSKMFEKHLWKSDILSKDAGQRPASLYINVTLPQLFFKHFVGKKQLPGFSISGTLVENGLRLHDLRRQIHCF